MGEAGMKILITGAHGFVGRNLTETLKAVRDGKDRTRGLPTELELLLYTRQSPEGTLEAYCAEADFVFHLAGVNRPETEEEFLTGNRDLTARLLSALEKAGNPCPVLLTSSIQALRDNPYGRCKLAGEDLVRSYGARTGAKTLIYRLPNLFGKWCRPNYNSVVATFCHNIANGLPIDVRDPAYSFPLVYIDDVVASFIAAMEGRAARDCSIPGYCHLMCDAYDVTLGRQAELIESFRGSRGKLDVPDMGDAFTRKLYATYLSYLPTDGFSYPLDMHCDARGSFTEFLRTPERGQVSVNISRPGVVKGNHWHHTKNEKFLVVKGEGIIRFRRLNTEAVYEYRVSGDKLEVVDIPTGYTHNIENVGESDMVTVMWASEPFDPERPDTYFLEV